MLRWCLLEFDKMCGQLLKWHVHGWRELWSCARIWRYVHTHTHALTYTCNHTSMLTNMYTRVCIHSLSCASCFWSVLSRLGCLQGPILTWVSALHGSGQYWAEIFTLPGEQCLDYSGYQCMRFLHCQGNNAWTTGYQCMRFLHCHGNILALLWLPMHGNLYC